MLSHCPLKSRENIDRVVAVLWVMSHVIVLHHAHETGVRLNIANFYHVFDVIVDHLR
jgi:hypothetical protein